MSGKRRREGRRRVWIEDERYKRIKTAHLRGAPMDSSYEKKTSCWLPRNYAKTVSNPTMKSLWKLCKKDFRHSQARNWKREA